MEYLLSLGILCLIRAAYFDWEEKLEVEHIIFLFVRLRAGKLSESFRRCGLECTPFFVTCSVFSGGQEKEREGWQWLGGHSSFVSSQNQKIGQYFGMKLDISGFNNTISNKWTTEKMQSLPLGKDGILSGGAKAEPAKFLSLLLEVTKTKVCSCFYSSLCFCLSTTDGGQSKGDTKLQRKNQWLLDKQGSWSSSGWLTESAQLGKCLLSQGCCFCRCLHILILSTVVRGRRKIKQYLIKERRKRRTVLLVMQTGHSLILPKETTFFICSDWLLKEIDRQTHSSTNILFLGEVQWKVEMVKGARIGFSIHCIRWNHPLH